jgi:hypothetical protein
MEDYIDNLDDNYKNLLISNISKIGLLTESDAVKQYSKDKLDNLKYVFNNAEIIDKNFSQIYQDIFVLTALDGKKFGTYLEIGSADPFKNNNTVLLETKFNWTGLGIEYNEELVKTYKNSRKNPILCSDALLLDYNKLLDKYFHNTKIIDYLQLDIDPPANTYEVLLSIPFDKYKFGVITYEHDFYIDITKSYREKSRQYLYDLGYVLMIPNASPNDNSPFEDWWVHPEIVNIDKLSSIQNKDSVNPVEKVLLK